MADKQVIIEFKVEGSEALNMTVALTDKLNELKAQKKELEKALKEDGGNKALKEQLAQVNAQIGSTSTSLRGYQNELKNMVKANEQETNSLKQKQAQLSVLTAQWDRLSEAERNSQNGQQLAADIQTTHKAVSELEQSTGRFGRNVGNYKQAILGAAEALKGVGGGASVAINGVKALGASLKALMANPWAALIGVIVGAFVKLRDAIKNNDEAGTAFKELFATLKPIINVIKSAFEKLAVVLANVAKKLADFNQRILKHFPTLDAWAKKNREIVKSQDELEEKERKTSMAVAQWEAEAARAMEIATDTEEGTLADRKKALDEWWEKTQSVYSANMALEQARFKQLVISTAAEHGIVQKRDESWDHYLQRIIDYYDLFSDAEKNTLVASVNAMSNLNAGLADAERQYNKVKKRMTKESVKVNAQVTTTTDEVSEEDLMQPYEDAAQKILDSVNKMRTELYKMGMDATQRAKFDLQQEWDRFDTEINNQLEGLQTKLADPKTTDAQKEQIQSLIRFYLDLMDQQDAIFQQRMDQYDVVQEKTQEIVQNQIATLDGVWWKLDENQKKALETADIIMKSTAQAAGSIAGLLNEVAGDNEELQKYAKAAGMVQILMSMGTGIAQAISAGSGLIFPANLVAIATGVATVVGGITSAIQLFKQTEAVAAPKFAQGGYVSGKGTGTSDDIMAWLSNGESVMTARTTKMFAPLLSAMNVAGGGAPITQAEQNNTMRNMWESAFSEMPAPVVSVKEVTNVANRVRIKENISSN